jgi:hypothetical protein
MTASGPCPILAVPTWSQKQCSVTQVSSKVVAREIAGHDFARDERAEFLRIADFAHALNAFPSQCQILRV